MDEPHLVVLEHRERRKFTPEEYLRLEEHADYRSEYYDGEIYAMTGGSLDHNRLVRNLVIALEGAFRGKGCEVFFGDVRLWVKRHKLFTYPDLLLICGEPKLFERRTDTVTDATVLAEVLSPATEAYDRGQKFRLYRALPSLQEYLTIAHSEVLIERHVKRGTGWARTEHREGDLQVLDVRIEVPAVYRGVK